MLKHYYFFYWLMALPLFAAAQDQDKPARPAIGVCVSDDHITQAKDAGFEFIVPSVSSYLKPHLTDDQFSDIVANENLPPVFACNIFFPSKMKCVGPTSNMDSVLAYAKIVFKRAKQVGVPIIVFGSGGARAIPDGFSKNLAVKQFTQLCIELSKLAQQYDVKIALENLNREETNLINTVEAAVEICEQVNMPNFGVNVDIYHMLKEDEPAKNILKARDYILICDIAEREKRTPPGVQDTDFGAYLRALKQIGYSGGIAVEARWDDFSDQATHAHRTLIRQLNIIY
ncbi:sugar phosphate isomerase/epimerase family protein [Parapedobacter tibetensis]|uniref:sugar phosphate isomerase/epimerase family protein n=1 Tax=Parapedobacter tibetensis TaxID=2972951 RepID=UPI00214D92B2|nr:sugar phosphate isomerase/epimerase family protein [Parapedobacter tibetensis]